MLPESLHVVTRGSRLEESLGSFLQRRAVDPFEAKTSTVQLITRSSVVILTRYCSGCAILSSPTANVAA